MIGIYLIKNTITGKVYIGKSKDVQVRWRGHKLDLRRGKHCNAYLQNSWNKYGESAFTFSVLEECSVEQLSEREIYYIQLYRSTDPDIGYNICTGGEGFTGAVSQEVKERISLALRGRKKPDGFGAKLSAATKGKVPESVRERLREAASDWWKTATPEQIAERKLHATRAWKEHKASEAGELYEPSRLTQEQRLSRSEITKKYWDSLTPEQRAARTAYLKGHKQSDEAKKKISIANKGRRLPPISEETRKKLSEASKGRKMPPKTKEQLARMSEVQKKYLAEHPEAIENLRRKAREQAARGMSDETRRKCQLASWKGAAARKGMTLEEYMEKYDKH